jgi:hypothetical protein
MSTHIRPCTRDSSAVTSWSRTQSRSTGHSASVPRPSCLTCPDQWKCVKVPRALLSQPAHPVAQRRAGDLAVDDHPDVLVQPPGVEQQLAQEADVVGAADGVDRRPR